jgi:hypothetical protein
MTFFKSKNPFAKKFFGRTIGRTGPKKVDMSSKKRTSGNPRPEFRSVLLSFFLCGISFPYIYFYDSHRVSISFQCIRPEFRSVLLSFFLCGISLPYIYFYGYPVFNVAMFYSNSSAKSH